MIVIDMDMPKNCFDCEFSLIDANGSYCAVADDEIREGLDVYIDTNNRSDICPIKCDIEDIKGEIQVIRDMYEGCEYIGDKARRDELWHVLEVIDKHTKGE